MKVLRFVFVLAFLVGFVAIGMNGTAWASKVGSSYQSPVANGNSQGLPVPARPQGTVNTTGPVVPLTDGQTITVGSSATVLVESGLAGVSYTGSVVADTDLPTGFKGNLLSSGIKIDASQGTTLGAPVTVSFPIPPGKTGFAYYWDGSQWVKTTLEVQDGQSSVVIPAGAPNPTFAALFDK